MRPMDMAKEKQFNINDIRHENISFEYVDCYHSLC